jgi:hypothetical protein
VMKSLFALPQVWRDTSVPRHGTEPTGDWHRAHPTLPTVARHSGFRASGSSDAPNGEARPRQRPGAINATSLGLAQSLMVGRAWARNRISSTITDAIVMAFRHDRARSGPSCSVAARTSSKAWWPCRQARRSWRGACRVPWDLPSDLHPVVSPGAVVAVPGALSFNGGFQQTR